MTSTPPIDNETLARAFTEVSTLLELTGDNPHRVRSYASVGRTLAGLPRPAREMLTDGTLTDVKGIGEGTAARVEELLGTGRLGVLEELRARVPAGLFELLEIPGLGPKRVREIWQHLEVTGLAELEYACLENRLRDLKGFGDKTQDAVLKGIGFLKRSRGLRLLSSARAAAERVLNRLQREASALRLAVTGSVRRMKSTVKDVNLLATSHDAKALLDAFTSLTFVSKVASRTEHEARVTLEDGTSVSLTVVDEDAFVPALLDRTGTEAHVGALRAALARKGLDLAPDAVRKKGKPLLVEEEREVYAAAGVPWFPPELRESGDLGHAPPNDLVAIADVVGILHAHSTWSDGAYSILEMAVKARESGFAWFAICDHSRAATYANGLDVDRVRAQWAEVDALNASGEARIPILKGIEADILPDGALDLPDDLLAGFDVVIGSVHSAFRQSAAVMTERLVRAVSHPYLDVLGHPTGRLLLGREGYAFDLDRVLDACARNGTAVELNANPYRLDLDEASIPEATRRGIPIAIDPDAHNLTGIEDVIFGVGAARRARVRRGDVLTALPIDAFRAWLAKRRGLPPPPPFIVRTPDGEETP